MFRLFRTPRRMEDLALFSRHLAGALGARVPLPDVLRAFMRDSEGDLSGAVGDVADDVEQGFPFPRRWSGTRRSLPPRIASWSGSASRAARCPA